MKYETSCGEAAHIYYRHINQNTLPLVAVTQNNTASIVKILFNFKHQNLLNVVILDEK